MSGQRKHPPSLKGKEIGLWYANQNKPTQKNNLVNMDFKLDSKNLERVVQVIKDVEKFGSLPIDSISEASSNITSSVKSEHPNNQCQICNSSDLDEYKLAEGDIMELPDEPLNAFMNTNLKGFSTEGHLKKNPEVDEQLKYELEQREKEPNYMANYLKRKKLPAFDMRKEILNAVSTNQVVVISGETGCGKTTQIPQYLLDDAISHGNGSCTRIVITQPRRISAVSVSERVAFERAQTLGEDVGYQIRLDSVSPRRNCGSMVFCTTGIVLQWFHSDPQLNGISHIIVDEVHEREMLGDFLIAMLKRLAEERPDLRIILMSATLNAEKFSSYFGNCPKLHIPGRLFPVEKFFLEDVLKKTKFGMPQELLDKFSRSLKRSSDKRLMSAPGPSITGTLRENYKHWLRKNQYSLPIQSRQFLEALGLDGCPPPDLVAATIDHILQNSDFGAILAFVPGLGDIMDTIKQLRLLNPNLYSESNSKVRIYPLHSRIPSARQRCVFDPPPHGQRKIIVATNIAETSITIEDVVYVVDCGQIKVTSYDPKTNTSTLAPTLVSKANAAQRSGRAGRIQPGKCYHLFSSFTMERVMLDNLPPEITRIRLEDIVLRIKVLDLGPVSEFLSNCLDPPDSDAIQRTVEFLRDIQALQLVDPVDKICESSVPVVRTSRMTKKQRHRLMTSAIQAGCDEARSTAGTVVNNDILTPLGYHLANLPLDPQCAKLLIFGAMFSSLEPVLAVAACLTFKDPFECSPTQQEAADRRRLELAGNSLSDHWVYHTVLSEYRSIRNEREKSQYCWTNFLNRRTMDDLCNLMRDYAAMLYERQYISTPNPNDSAANRNTHNLDVFRVVLAGAFYPNIIMATGKPSRNPQELSVPIYEGRKSEGAVYIHRMSINASMRLLDRVWMAYFSRMKLDHGAKSTIFDTTVFNSRAVIFFSTKHSNLKIGEDEFLLIDDWVKFKTTPKLATLVKRLKGCMDQLLDCKIRRPSITNWDPKFIEGRLMECIVNFFTSEPPPVASVKPSNTGPSPYSKMQCFNFK